MHPGFQPSSDLQASGAAGRIRNLPLWTIVVVQTSFLGRGCASKGLGLSESGQVRNLTLGVRSLNRLSYTPCLILIGRPQST